MASAEDRACPSALAEKSTAVSCQPRMRPARSPRHRDRNRRRGRARRQVADLGQQMRVRWHLRDLVAGLLKGLPPASLPGVPPVTRSSLTGRASAATRASTSSTAAAATSQPSSAHAVRQPGRGGGCAGPGVVSHSRKRACQGRGVLTGDEQAGYLAAGSSAECLPYPAHVGGQHGYAASQGLAGHDAVGLVA